MSKIHLCPALGDEELPFIWLTSGIHFPVCQEGITMPPSCTNINLDYMVEDWGGGSWGK